MRIDKVFSYFNMIDRNKSKAIEKGKNENYDAYMDIDGEGKNTKEEAKYALFKRVLEAQRTAPKLRTVEQKKLLSINKNEYELTLDEIADITGLSSGNIRIKLHRSRKKMYKVISESLKSEISSIF